MGSPTQSVGLSDLAWALGPGKGRFLLSREGGQLPDTERPVADTGGGSSWWSQDRQSPVTQVCLSPVTQVTGLTHARSFATPASDKVGPLAVIMDPLAGTGALW